MTSLKSPSNCNGPLTEGDLPSKLCAYTLVDLNINQKNGKREVSYLISTVNAHLKSLQKGLQ